MQKFVEDKMRDAGGKAFEDTPEHVKAFLCEIMEVCRKHGISLSHEDGHGNFVLEPFSEFYCRWLGTCSASIKVMENKQENKQKKVDEDLGSATIGAQLTSNKINI